mgnify:FL=1
MGVVVALIALAVRRVDRDIADHPAAAVRPLGEVGSPEPARQWKEGKDLMAFPKALRLGIAAAPPAVANTSEYIFQFAILILGISIVMFHKVGTAIGISHMITGPQMRAARALLGIDQKTLAELSGLSVPTIQRMEASAGNVRGVVDSLTKIVTALELAGVELIGEGIPSTAGGRGVRLKPPPPKV